MNTKTVTAQNCSLFEIDAELEEAFDQLQEEHASTYTPIVIPLHGDNYPDGTFTDLEDGVMFNFTGRGAVQMSWIAKDARTVSW